MSSIQTIEIFTNPLEEIVFLHAHAGFDDAQPLTKTTKQIIPIANFI
jgi:hypothetical protein